MKAKNAARMKAFRQKLTGSERIKYLAAHAASQQRYKKKRSNSQ